VESDCALGHHGRKVVESGKQDASDGGLKSLVFGSETEKKVVFIIFVDIR